MPDLTTATTDDDEKLVAHVRAIALILDERGDKNGALVAYIAERLSALKAQVEHWRTATMIATARAESAASERQSQGKTLIGAIAELKGALAECRRLEAALAKTKTERGRLRAALRDLCADGPITDIGKTVAAVERGKLLLLELGDGWQDIATAPDDGRLVWVWGGRHVTPIATQSDGGFWRTAGLRGVPTHWAPCEPPALPAPPSETAANADKEPTP